jgi:uroporphyrinogen decarboxylase
VTTTCRERVLTALAHRLPDRVPCDLLAVPEVWHKLQEALEVESREAVLRTLEVDCRRVSYDSYCAPPERVVADGTVEWWDHPARSTTERTWRLRSSDGLLIDIWGARRREVEQAYGRYEELVESPLADAMSLGDLRAYEWPTPHWFDFSGLPDELATLDRDGECHIRYRIGSLFETAWSLRGFQQTLMDLALEPKIPCYVMDRLLEVHMANLETVLNLAGERIDMVYYYDDLASKDSLLISEQMWRKTIKPRQEQLLQVAHDHGKPIMYHCDGSIFRLIPELMDMGISLLNPIQMDAKDMDPGVLKRSFGERLSFHGGVDISDLLPNGNRGEIEAEVRRLVHVLGEGGGYILAPTHHMQADAPVENILAMYEVDLR